MMNRTEAKEMAKYLVMGVDHFETGKEKRDFVGSVLERYNIVEKDKTPVVETVPGSEVPFDEEEERDM